MRRTGVNRIAEPSSAQIYVTTDFDKEIGEAVLSGTGSFTGVQQGRVDEPDR
jgi:hypothetical protein